MERFWRHEFFANFENMYVIPYPTIDFCDVKEVKDGMIDSFQTSVQSHQKSIQKIYRANAIAVAISGMGLPRKVMQNQYGEYTHEYVSVYCAWNEDIELYVSFCKEDSQETKDEIVEYLLSQIHKGFGVLWERDTNEHSTRFTGKINGVMVKIVMYDTLGCFIEVIEEERVLSDYELAALVEQADGTFVNKDAVVRRNKEGKLVRTQKAIKAHCSGSPE